jgi:hypothetical protein
MSSFIDQEDSLVIPNSSVAPSWTSHRVESQKSLFLTDLNTVSGPATSGTIALAGRGGFSGGEVAVF